MPTLVPPPSSPPPISSAVTSSAKSIIVTPEARAPSLSLRRAPRRQAPGHSDAAVEALLGLKKEVVHKEAEKVQAAVQATPRTKV